VGTATGAGSFSVTVNGTATFPGSGAAKAGYLLLYGTSAPALIASPNGVAPGSAFSSGTQIAIAETSLPTTPTLTGLSVSGLIANTTYNLLIVPYTWDGVHTSTYNYYTSTRTSTVTTLPSGYYWNGASNIANPAAGGTGNWSDANNWRIDYNGSLANWADANPVFLGGTAGTVTLSASVAPTSTTVQTSGYTLASSGSSPITLSGDVSLGANGITAAPISGADLTMSGIISGASALTKSDAGTLFLNNGSNSYSSGTIINAGVLSVDGTNSLGATAGTLTINNGTFQLTSGISSARPITIGHANSAFDISTSQSYTAASASLFSGSGRLNKTGSGTLIFPSANATSHTYSGLTITNGTVQINKERDLGNTLGSATPGYIVINGGTLASATILTITTNRGIAVGPSSGSGSGTIDVATSTTLTYAGIIANNSTGTGSLIKTGAGILTLTGASNSFSGSTTISAGTLTLSGSGSISTSPSISIGSGSIFDVTGLTSALTLGASQTLKTSTTGSNTTATINVTSTKGITLSAGGLEFSAYGGGATVPLTINGATAGALALNSAPITLTTTSTLNSGTYTLITKSGSATGVSGTPGTLTVNGSGVSSGNSAILSVVSGELILTVSSTPDILLADNGTQVAPAPANQGTAAVVLQKIQLGVTTYSASLTGMTCTTTGTYASADITNLKVRYSVDNVLDAGDATLSTYTTPGAAGAKTFPSFVTQAITAGSTGYIFITADFAATATYNNTIGLNAIATTDLTFASGNKTGSTTAGGTQTINDVTAPTVSTYSPADGNTAVTINQNLILTFSEPVKAGTAGSIDIYNSAGLFESIPYNDSRITFSTNTVTINPTGTFGYGGNYYVQISGTAITDIAGNAYSGISDATTWNFTTVGPTVTSVTSTTADGTYGVGSVINVSVNFSDVVFVSNLPRVQLSTGSVNHYSTYVSGTGSSTISFEYTVQTSDVSSDLNYLATTSLGLNGSGTINTADGIPAILTLPALAGASSLAGQKAIVIDAVAPTVSTYNPTNSATGVAVASNLVLTFVENIQKGTGNITIKKFSDNSTIQTIDVNSADVIISSATLTINPPTDLAIGVKYYILIDATAIKDLNGNSYAGIPNNASWSFTTIAPTVTNVTSSTADGTYKIGDVVNVAITFTDNVTVTGTPRIQLETGTTDEYATYSSGSGANTLNFSYTVVSGDVTTDLDYKTNSLALNSGTINSTDGIVATLTLPAVGGVNSIAGQKTIVIDGILPTLLTLSPTDGNTTVTINQNLAISFSEPVKAGTAGNIVIYKGDGTVFETIPYNDSRITFSTNTATINPTGTFAYSTDYYVQIAATAISDIAGNAYAGILTTTTWNFTTECGSISSFPATESFSASLGCWTASEAVANATYHWSTTTADATNGVASPQSGTYFAFLNVFNASTSYNQYYLTSPSIVLDGTVKQVRYYYWLGNTGNKTNPVPLSLQISNDNGATWTDIYQHTSSNSVFGTSSTSPWTQNVVYLTSYVNQTVIFRFASNSNYGTGFCNQGIDEFSIENAVLAPTANSANSVSSSGFTANWGSVTGANSYKLDVATNSLFNIPDLTENFNGCVTGSISSPDNTDISTTLNTYLQTTGWAGASVYQAGGSIKLGGASSLGYLTTKTIDLSAYSGNATLSFDLMLFGTDTGTSIQVFHAPDGSTFTQVGTDFTATSTSTPQTVSITGGTANSKIKISAKIATKNRFYLDNISVLQNKIVSGYDNLNVASTSQPVSGLSANSTYYYRVRAVGTNNTSSNSGTITVLTATNAPVATAASNLTSTSFSANWNTVTGATGYLLDVATDNSFSSLVSGYSNLAVSGLTQSISGLTPNTSYYYRVRATNGNASVNSGTITVTTKNTSSVVLNGTISFTYTGSTQTPAFTKTGSANSLTYSYTGTGATSYSSTSAPSAVGTYTVTASVAADASYDAASSSATAFTIAKANTTVTVTVGSYTYNASAQGPNAVTTTSTGTVSYSYVGVSGTTYAASSTAPTGVGSYTVTASVTTDANYNAASSSATAFSITAIAADAVAGSIGTSSLLPGTDLTVPNGVLLTVDNVSPTTVHSITVAPGGQLTLADGKVLNSTLTLQNTASASASYVDNNSADTPPTLASTVNQDIAATDRNWYVSVPVSAKTTTALSFGASILKRDESTVAWTTLRNGADLVPGVGYISTASTAGTTTWNISGNLNNGKIQVPVTALGASYTGYNLLGNPYPSYLNWSAVLVLNSGNASILQSSIWYRTKTGGSYTFQTYNATGDVGTPISTSGNIATMQAFWVLANTGGGTVTLTNAMRSHGDGSANPIKLPSATKSIKQLLRLQVSNAIQTDETVVYFNADASNDYDAFDSPKMSNANAAIPEIYTLAGTKQLVINGMKTLPSTFEMPLGFSTGQSNNFTIEATEISNFAADTRIFLLDKLLNTDQELTTDAVYTFSSDQVSSADRFSLIFKTPSVTDGLNSANEGSFWISSNASNEIIVHGLSDANTTVTVYNEVGQKLLSTNLLASDKALRTPRLVPGVYLLTVNTAGKNVTRKVILK